jgi:pullulanase
MCAIKGTHVKDGGWAQRPQQCINYLSSHDGKTLCDIVDGNKQRVFLGALLVLTSQGVPMLAEGTELMFTKHGHDNSYDRPDLNQINWDNARTHRDLVDAVTRLISLRKSLSHFHYARHLRQRHGDSEQWDIDWIFPTGHPHHDNVNAIGYVLRAPVRKLWRGREPLVVLLNGSDKGAEFRLPKGLWKVLVDGCAIKVNAQGLPGVAHARGSYYSHPGTGAVLARV